MAYFRCIGQTDSGDYETITGNPISITNAKPLNAVGLTVDMLPIQAGSGTPSPSNPRPISGRNSLDITVNGNTETVNFGETVYGGTCDVVNGGTSSTYGVVDLGTIDWLQATASGHIVYRTQSNTIPFKNYGDTRSTQGVCSEYEMKTTADNDTCFFYGTSFYVRNDNFIDETDCKNSMSGVILCYEKATPTTLTTPATSISLNKGNNTLSTSGDNMELKYYALADYNLCLKPTANSNNRQSLPVTKTADYLSIDYTKDWELRLTFSPKAVSSTICLWGTSSSSSGSYFYKNPTLEISNNGASVWGGISINGTAWTNGYSFGGTLASALVVGKWYEATMSYKADTKTATFTIKDVETGTVLLTRTSTNSSSPYSPSSPSSEPLCFFGNASGSNYVKPYQMNIDLNNSYVINDGQLLWGKAS